MDFLTGKKEAAKKLSETRLATKVIKPPIEELDQFLEFQLPWQGPVYGDLLHAPRPKKNTSLSLQFKVKLEVTKRVGLAGKKRDPKGNGVVVAGLGLSAPVSRVEALVVDDLRRRGRQKLMWEDRVKLDMKELLLSKNTTSDRNE
ncbi:hypothetical protein Tco_1145742 [Tanacetum coccineum]